MNRILSGLLMLAWLAAGSLSAHAGKDTVAYKPGAIKAAIANGEIVFVDYKASW